MINKNTWFLIFIKKISFQRITSQMKYTSIPYLVFSKNWKKKKKLAQLSSSSILNLVQHCEFFIRVVFSKGFIHGVGKWTGEATSALSSAGRWAAETRTPRRLLLYDISPTSLFFNYWNSKTILIDNPDFVKSIDALYLCCCLFNCFEVELLIWSGRLYAMERGLRIPQSDRTKTTNDILVALMSQLEKVSTSFFSFFLAWLVGASNVLLGRLSPDRFFVMIQ